MAVSMLCRTQQCLSAVYLVESDPEAVVWEVQGSCESPKAPMLLQDTVTRSGRAQLCRSCGIEVFFAPPQFGFDLSLAATSLSVLSNQDYV